MEREVSTGGEPYVIVSSDTHAGLKCEEYRPYLDSALHAEFDDYVAERHEHRRVAEELNSEFVNQWEGENEWGLQGAYDPEVRDPVLDADGVAGVLVAVKGTTLALLMAMPSRGRSRHHSGPAWPPDRSPILVRPLGAPGPTTAGWRSSAPPTRYAGLA